MKVAIVGTGYVADAYLKSLPRHPEMSLTGVYDKLADRAHAFAAHHRTSTYPSLAAVCEDPQVELVLNLTNPRDHYEVSKALLQAGKHVYSEKPMAMNMDHARELMAIARERGLQFVSAPCTVLSETCQTLWQQVRKDTIGRIRVVYAELDDGLIYQDQYEKWVSSLGTPWPYKDEFEVGCTLEHAGYYVSWMLAWFGPAKSVTAFASVQVPDKMDRHPGEALDLISADFSVACIQFHNGVVARLTCSICAPHNHQIRIYGDKGYLGADECWHFRAPVFSRKRIKLRSRFIYNPFKSKHPLPEVPYRALPGKSGQYDMDFFRGPAEMAAALRENRPCALTPEYSLHVNEISIAIHEALHGKGHVELTTTFQPMQPMKWAL
jgi:predicted dehydrogenase